MTSFGISTPRDLLGKLVEEERDFKASACLSARYAINATMTAYHLYEWVWGGFAKHHFHLPQYGDSTRRIPKSAMPF
jgi:hypothetical protein